jgi:hypothetical protein
MHAPVFVILDPGRIETQPFDIGNTTGAHEDFIHRNH